ncbi:MAG: hypothetical protein Q8R16_00835 [bacterium]|nr:hypothetical protein [bacterium]
MRRPDTDRTVFTIPRIAGIDGDCPVSYALLSTFDNRIERSVAMPFASRIEEIDRVDKITEEHRPHILEFYRTFERIEELQRRRSRVVTTGAILGALIVAFIGWGPACERAVRGVNEYVAALLFPWILAQFAFFLAIYGAAGALISGIAASLITSSSLASRIGVIHRELKVKLDGDPIAREAFRQLLATDEAARQFARANLVDVVI